MSHQHVKNDLPYCRNCNHPVTEDDKFCASCGQKSTDGKVSMHDLLHEFVHTWLHVDGKFFKTALHLFVPGKLTVEFFKGRHKRYAHPVQLFFLLTVLSIAISIWALKGASSQVEAQSEAAKTRAIAEQYKSGLKIAFDSATHNRPTLTAWSDSVLMKADTLFEGKIAAKLQKLYEDSSTSGGFTSGLMYGFSLRKEQTNKRDSLKALTDTAAAKILLSEKEAKDLMVIRKIKFKKNDLLLLSDEELTEKYQLNTATNLWGRTVIRAIAHIMQRGGDFIGYFMSKILWISIFTIPFLAWFLKLLYRRQKRFYVEHVVFLCHWFAFSAVSSIVSSLLIKAGFVMVAGLFSYIVPFVYLLIAMSAFYQQSGGKTLAKFLLFCFVHLFCMMFFTVIGLVVSAVLF